MLEDEICRVNAKSLDVSTEFEITSVYHEANRFSSEAA